MQHPMTQWLTKANNGKPLPQKAMKLLTSDIVFTDVGDRKITYFGGLIHLYDTEAGFRQFCDDTLTWMSKLNGYKVINLASFLCNVDKPAEGNKKPGFHAWLKANPQYVPQEPVPAEPTPVRIDRIEKPTIEQLRIEARREMPGLQGERLEAEAQKQYEYMMKQWNEQEGITDDVC